MSITALTVLAEPTTQVLTVDEAKQHLRVSHNAENPYIADLIASASDWASTYMRRVLIDTQVSLSFDCFPSVGNQYFGQTYSVFSRHTKPKARDRGIFLSGGVVSAVNKIDYTDADGAPQILTGPTSATPGTDYQEDITDDEWPLVFPAAELDWPSTEAGAVNAVTVDYQAGWANAAALPQAIRQAVRFKMADMYTIRDTIDAQGKSQLISAAEHLLDPYVVTLI